MGSILFDVTTNSGKFKLKKTQSYEKVPILLIATHQLYGLGIVSGVLKDTGIVLENNTIVNSINYVDNGDNSLTYTIVSKTPDCWSKWCLFAPAEYIV